MGTFGGAQGADGGVGWVGWGGAGEGDEEGKGAVTGVEGSVEAARGIGDGNFAAVAGDMVAFEFVPQMEEGRGRS